MRTSSSRGSKDYEHQMIRPFQESQWGMEAKRPKGRNWRASARERNAASRTSRGVRMMENMMNMIKTVSECEEIQAEQSIEAFLSGMIKAVR